MRVLTKGTARAVFQHFRTRDYFLDDQLLPTPHLYFLYFQLWLLSAMARLTRDERKLCLVAEGPNKGLAELKKLMEIGPLNPVIDRVYPLREVAEAFRHFSTGRHKGKVVISVEPSSP